MMNETICLPGRAGISTAFLLHNLDCSRCKCEIQSYRQLCYLREQTCDTTHTNPSYKVKVIAWDGNYTTKYGKACCNALVNYTYVPIGEGILYTRRSNKRQNEKSKSSKHWRFNRTNGKLLTTTPKVLIGEGSKSNTSRLDSSSTSDFTRSGSNHGHLIHVSLTVLLAISLVAAIVYIFVGKCSNKDSKRRSSVNNPTYSDEHQQDRILVTNTPRSDEYFTIDEIGAEFNSSSSTKHISVDHHRYENTQQASLSPKMDNLETTANDDRKQAVCGSSCIMRGPHHDLKRNIEKSDENSQEKEESEEESERNDDNLDCLPIEIANTSTYDTITDQNYYFAFEKLKDGMAEGGDEEKKQKEVAIKGENC